MLDYRKLRLRIHQIGRADRNYSLFSWTKLVLPVNYKFILL